MLRLLCLLLCMGATSAQDRDSSTWPSTCEPVSTAEDIAITTSNLERGDAVRLCFEGTSERNISLSGKLHIPEHAQLMVDCGGGAISLLAAPTLAYGSLLGFSQCMLTTFRPGESPTAKPSTPQYMFNWDADSALLLLEDSILEQPCSVFDAYALMPLIAAGSEHETARIGPEAPRGEGLAAEPSATLEGDDAPPAQSRRALKDAEAPAADTAGEGSEGGGEGSEGAGARRRERYRQRAVSFIEMHLLAPLSEMVVHFDNVTSWGCAASWEAAAGVVQEAMRLAETEGAQPLPEHAADNSTDGSAEVVGLQDAAAALHGDISDTPWVSLEACRVCSPLPVAPAGSITSRVRMVATTSSGPDSRSSRTRTSIIIICFSIVGVALLAGVVLLVAHRRLARAQACLTKQEAAVTTPRGDQGSPPATGAPDRASARPPVPPVSATSGIAPSSSSTCSHESATVQAPVAAGAFQHTGSSHSRRKLHVGTATATNRTVDGKAASMQSSALQAPTAATGSQRCLAPLLPLRLPSQRDTCASPLSVNSGCGTPGYGTSGCYTPYSHIATPPSGHVATPTSHNSARHLEAAPPAEAPRHERTSSLSFAFEALQRRTGSMHDSSAHKLAWKQVRQAHVEPTHPVATAKSNASDSTESAPLPAAPAGDVQGSGAFVACNAGCNRDLGGVHAAAPPKPPTHSGEQPQHSGHSPRGPQGHDSSAATADTAAARPLTQLLRHSAPTPGDDSGYSSLFCTLDGDEGNPGQEEAGGSNSTISVQLPVLPQTPLEGGSGPGAMESVPVAARGPRADSISVYDSFTSVSGSRADALPGPMASVSLIRTSSRGMSLAACMRSTSKSRVKAVQQREMRAAMRAKRRQMPRSKRKLARHMRNAQSDEPVTARDLQHLGSLPGEDVRVPDAALSVQGNNQLRVFRVLGAGGFATVFHGEWRGLEVAIKKLDISSKCAKARARLASMATEATIASNLVHPNVVATYTHGLSTSANAIDHTPSGPGRPAATGGGALATGEAKYLMVQEYCNGGSLRNAIVEGALGPPAGGGLERRWLPLMHIAKSIAEGMRYLHSQRILHGDLNPANILLKVPGGCATRAEGLRQAVAVKITDFGLSHRLPSGEEHAANMCVGTPFFMAPEVLALKHFYPASDVFSFGVTMWELMAGTAAFVKPASASPSPSSPTNDEQPQAGSPPAGSPQAGSPPARSYEANPAFPSLPASVPLAYSLALRACLHPEPHERPTFAQLSKILSEVVSEVSEGVYVNSKGLLQAAEAADVMPFDDVADCIVPDCSFVDETSSVLSRRMLQDGFHAALSGLLSGSSCGDVDDTLRTDTLCTTASHRVDHVDRALSALPRFAGCESTASASGDGSALPTGLALDRLCGGVPAKGSTAPAPVLTGGGACPGGAEAAPLPGGSPAHSGDVDADSLMLGCVQLPAGAE